MPLNPIQQITGKKLIFSSILDSDITFADNLVNELNTANMDVRFIDNNFIKDSNAGYYAFQDYGQIEIVIKNGLFTNADAVNDYNLLFGIGQTTEYKLTDPVVLAKNSTAVSFDLDETIEIDKGNRLLIQGNTNLSILQRSTSNYTWIEIYLIAD